MAKKEIDEISGVETTGHEWDGIRELNNPMPRWWVWTFYATIVWALGYTILYPAWPGLTGATKGTLGYSSRAELAQDVADATASQKAYLDKIAATPVAEIVKDKDLAQFAIQGGAAAFKINCAPCHGTGADGGKQGMPSGYANLNDNDWIWGGSIEAIYATIAHGVRAANPDTRDSMMQAFGDGTLTPEQIKQVSAYVVSLTGTPADAGMVEPGKTIFAENCAACHGEDARGNRELGAPNLADAIWLIGEGEQAVIAQVTAPKHGVMPAWLPRLGERTVKELAVYVHQLGGGE